MDSQTNHGNTGNQTLLALEDFLACPEEAYNALGPVELDELAQTGIDGIQAQMLEELSAISKAQERLKRLEFLEAKLATHLIHAEKKRRLQMFPKSEGNKYGYIEGSTRWLSSNPYLSMHYKIPVPGQGNANGSGWKFIRSEIPRSKSGWGIRALKKRKATDEELELMKTLADLYNTIHDEHTFCKEILRAQKKITERVLKRFGNSPDYLEGFL